MRRIAIVNEKGGSGKTTTAVNLAACLAEKGRRVLLIDLDAQASATYWYGIKDSGSGLFDFFQRKAELQGLVWETDTPGVDIVPSCHQLTAAEKDLAAKKFGADSILKRGIEALPADLWDYILIDCAPAVSIITANALAAVNEVLIPVETSIMAVAGLAQLKEETLREVRELLNPDLQVIGILACRVDSRTRHSEEVLATLRSEYPELVFNTSIRSNVKLSEAPSFHQPITSYDPKCHGSEDYRSLAAEIIAQEDPG